MWGGAILQAYKKLFPQKQSPIIANLPYGTNPTPEQQKNIVKFPSLSTPIYASEKTPPERIWTKSDDLNAYFGDPNAPKPNPDTGGQGQGTINLTSPTGESQPSEAELAARIRPQYDVAAQDIQNQGGQLDTSYNLAKGDIATAQEATQRAAATQKTENAQTFGNLLRDQLRTYQDLNRQRMGTFAGLGTLESSAYGEQQFRGDQAYGEQRGTTLSEQTKRDQAIDDQVSTYSKQASSDLAKLALSYQAGKNSVASALANNDLNRAAAIQAAIDKVKARAVEIQNSIIDFANKAQTLKTLGYSVQTNIAGQNPSDYVTQVNNLLGNMTKTGNSLYTIPAKTDQGQGYIAPNGKKYSSEDEYLRLRNLGQA